MSKTIDQLVNTLVISSERYAITRSSYSSTETAEAIREFLEMNMLTKDTMRVLIVDIRDAIKWHSITWGADRDEWQKTLNMLVERHEL